MSNSLTWNDFKKHVDIILTTKGINPNLEIQYIDISFPDVKNIGVEGSGWHGVSVDIEGPEDAPAIVIWQ